MTPKAVQETRINTMCISREVRRLLRQLEMDLKDLNEWDTNRKTS